MEDTILSSGVEKLSIIKKNIQELNGYKDDNDVLNSEEVKLEKSILNKEKAISDEISSTTKKRKDEIEDSYNAPIETIRTRIKKIRSKKEKSKNTKKTERIEAETAELREEFRQLSLEGKATFKKNKIPAACNTKLFYSLFMPKGMGDLLIICISLILVLFALPCFIYFIILPEEQMIYLVLIYIITVVFFGGIYMLIENNIKDKHRDSIQMVRIIRNNMVQNKKKRKKIKKNIVKDKDESLYGLEKFNQELQELDKEILALSEQKKEALTIFENTTRFVISEEIKLRHQEELAQIQREYDRIYTEVKNNEVKIKKLSIDITSYYETYLGKEFMSVEKLSQLESLMNDNKLATISEAITLYKQENN